jgi:hypothetical protein
MLERLLHPDAPEFAPIHADLARLFIAHKGDMGLGDWTDAEVTARVDDVASTLINLSLMALDARDQTWFEQHQWWARRLRAVVR